MKKYKIPEEQISVSVDAKKASDSESNLIVTWKNDYFPTRLAKGKSNYSYVDHMMTISQKEEKVEEFENSLRKECYVAESGPYVRTIVITPPHNDEGSYEVHIKTFYKTKELSNKDEELHSQLHGFGPSFTFDAESLEEARQIMEVWFDNFECEVERNPRLRNDAGTTSNDQTDDTTYETLRTGSKEIEPMYDSFRRQIRGIKIDDLIKKGVIVTFINTGRIGVDAIRLADGSIKIIFHKSDGRTDETGRTDEAGYERFIQVGDLSFTKEEFDKIVEDSDELDKSYFYTTKLHRAIFWGILYRLGTYIRERDNDVCPAIEEIPVISYIFEKDDSQYEVAVSTYPSSQCHDNILRGRKFKIRIKKQGEVIKELDALLGDDGHNFLCNEYFRGYGQNEYSDEPTYDLKYNFNGSLDELRMILYEIFMNVMEDYQKCTINKVKNGPAYNRSLLRVYTPKKNNHVSASPEDELPF